MRTLFVGILEKEVQILRETKQKNYSGELLTVKQMCELSNLGINRVRTLAEESGSLRKIGKSVRIRPKVFFDYLDKEYSL